MSKKDEELREMLHKYRKQARELLAIIEESKRKDRERADAQAKAEARQRVAQRAHRDGTVVPVRQGKSTARAAIFYPSVAPGDVATTNIPTMTRVRVSFPKD